MSGRQRLSAHAPSLCWTKPSFLLLSQVTYSAGSSSACESAHPCCVFLGLLLHVSDVHVASPVVLLHAICLGFCMSFVIEYDLFHTCLHGRPACVCLWFKCLCLCMFQADRSHNRLCRMEAYVHPYYDCNSHSCFRFVGLAGCLAACTTVSLLRNPQCHDSLSMTQLSGVSCALLQVMGCWRGAKMGASAARSTRSITRRKSGTVEMPTPLTPPLLHPLSPTHHHMTAGGHASFPPLLLCLATWSLKPLPCLPFKNAHNCKPPPPPGAQHRPLSQCPHFPSCLAPRPFIPHPLPLKP